MNTNFDDPWEFAEQAKEPHYSNIIWGKCEAKSWWCILEKGTGRVEFDPQIHSQDQKRAAIDIIIRPLSEMNMTFDVIRRMIAESREWASFTLPSIRDLEISPKQLNGLWVKVQTVPLTDKAGNAITYTNEDGVIKEKTALKFLAIFKDEEECRADYIANGGQAQPKTAQSTSNTNGNKERETALAFLKVYVENACRGQHDLNVIRETLALNIAQQPLISKYFTVDSQETVKLITEAMAR